MSDEIDQIPTIPAKASTIAPGTPDRNGVPFDSARHIAKQHPRSGAWMPKGGRKPKTATPSSGSTSSQPASTEPATSATSSPSPAGSPAADPTADLGREMAATMPEVTVEPPASASSNAKPDAPAGGGSFIPADEPKAPDAKAELCEDAKSSVEDNAELACQTLYTLTGLATGKMQDAKPAKDEHAAIRRTLAAYFRARGWAAVGTFAIVITVLAYFVRTGQKEDTAAVIRKWWATLRARKAAARSDTAEAGEPTQSGHTTPAHSRVIVVD